MDVHIFFLPFLAPGHMIPMVDLACLFASHGAKASIITTTANVPLIQPTINLKNANPSLRHQIQILPLHFPSLEFGIPEGHENLLAFKDPDLTIEFISAVNMLEDPFKQLLKDHRPDCILSHIFYHWATKLAEEFNIPRLVFHGTNSFFNVISNVLGHLRLHESEQAFDVPGLPHQIQFTWSQLPEFIKKPNESIKRLSDGYRTTFGMVVNSFYEIEREYIDLIKKENKMKLWNVGPVSLHNRCMNEKTVRGNIASISSDECLKWLDDKMSTSVLYVCFGSLGRFTTTQLREIALGLESSGHPFIWVVPRSNKPSEWLPEGFEKRISDGGKGLLIRGWAPQLLILSHEAVGGFVTHCGWNSCLEGVSAGVPMVTWPLFAEQFFNEKLIVGVLKIGIAIGTTICSTKAEDRALVKEEEIRSAVEELMGCGEDAKERRKRARELGEIARNAVEEGGSSCTDTNSLLEDLVNLKAIRLGNTM